MAQRVHNILHSLDSIMEQIKSSQIIVSHPCLSMLMKAAKALMCHRWGFVRVLGNVRLYRHTFKSFQDLLYDSLKINWTSLNTFVFFI
jgi:hypothetical protein